MVDQSKIKVGHAVAMEGEKVNGGFEVIKKFKDFIFIFTLRHVSLIIAFCFGTLSPATNVIISRF